MIYPLEFSGDSACIPSLFVDGFPADIFVGSDDVSVKLLAGLHDSHGLSPIAGGN